MGPRYPRGKFRHRCINRSADTVPLERGESVDQVEVQHHEILGKARIAKGGLQLASEMHERLSPARHTHSELTCFDHSGPEPLLGPVHEPLAHDPAPYLSDPDRTGRR